MAGYTKEFLIDAFIWRYTEVLDKMPVAESDAYIEMVKAYYDKAGRDKFRVFCSLDADEIRKFKLATRQ